MLGAARPADRVLPWDNNIAKNYSNIFDPYKLILVCGVIGSGKTHFCQNLNESKFFTRGYWSKGIILDNVFKGCDNFHGSFYNSVDQAEKILIPTALNHERHAMIMEGWYRVPSQRKQAASYTEGRKMCVVIDGPNDLILERAHKKYGLLKSKDELSVIIDHQKSSFVWPTHDEGWDAIIYLDTFNETEEQSNLSDEYFITTTFEVTR